MRLNDISPFVRQAIMARMSIGKYVSYKLRTRDHRIFYIMGGVGNIVIEGISYPIRAGMTVLLRSGTEYIWQVGDMRYLSLNFDYTRRHSHLTRSFHVERAEAVDSVLEPDANFEDAEELNSPVVLYDFAAIEASIMNIVSEFALRGKYAEEYLSSLLFSVIVKIARRRAADESDRGRDNAGVREIIAYVARHYTQPIKNTDIAAALHFNPSYMNRLFKAHTGITVRAFLIDYRINAAIDLISGGELSTTALAAAVGFTDVPHFIKTFKAHTGKTPKEYGKG